MKTGVLIAGLLILIAFILLVLSLSTGVCTVPGTEMQNPVSNPACLYTAQGIAGILIILAIIIFWKARAKQK